MNRRPPQPRRLRHRGATLIEVASATVLTSLLLIPSLSLLDQSRRLNERHELREHMVFEAQRLLDIRKAELDDLAIYLRDHRRPTGVVTTGTLASRGLPEVAYQLTTIADPNYTTAGSEILMIRVQVWQDLNRDRRLDSDEPAAQLFSKLSRPTS